MVDVLLIVERRRVYLRFQDLNLKIQKQGKVGEEWRLWEESSSN